MWRQWEHRLQAHSVIALWLAAGGAAANTVIRQLPRLILEIVAIRTRDPATRSVCLETIRLRRRDAASLPTYLNPPIADCRSMGPSAATPDARGAPVARAGRAAGAGKRRNPGHV